MSTDGTRLSVEYSGDFGASPFFGQLSVKQRHLTARGRYADFNPGVSSGE